MEGNENQRKAIEEYYARLTPAERRERVLLQPTFRDLYNEITEAHRIVQVPRYFWVKWVPILGPIATALYMQLRQYCYFNPKTGEIRNLCWPKQATLGRDIGVRDKKTIRKALVLLEEHGFIKRERTYYKDSDTGKPHQGTDRYLVYFEIPLVTEDAVDLLIRESTQGASADRHYEGAESPHSAESVDNSSYGGKFSPHIAGEEIPRRTITRTSTYNVTNVIGQNPLRQKGQARARSADLPAEELNERESLAGYIGDQLGAMDGNWRGEGHKSAGFHRRVALAMPSHLVHEALAATRDAIEDDRGGRRTVRRGAGAYFAGAIRRIAEREHIDLGVHWGRKESATEEPGPHGHPQGS